MSDLGQFEALRDHGFAYTVASGRLFCSMAYFQEQAEKLLGRPVLTHEFADGATWSDLRAALEDALTEREQRASRRVASVHEYWKRER